MSGQDLFHQLCKEIQVAYTKFGYSLNWSFLYTPEATFNSEQKLLFIALNPAGNKAYPVSCSCNLGNDYLYGNWNGQPGESFLQIQVQKLFKTIASHLLHCSDYEELMDDILAANYVPFRSPEWSMLPSKDKVESRQFAYSLWSEVLEFIKPRVIITISWEPYNDLISILRKYGFKGEEKQNPINWGKVTYSVNHLHCGDNKLLLVRLPHLSKYKVFNRDKCRSELNKICMEIAQIYGG